MIRGIIGLALSLVLAAVIYFVFIEPNIDDVKESTDDALQGITEPDDKKAKRTRRDAERFARCVQRKPDSADHVKRCRVKHLK